MKWRVARLLVYIAIVGASLWDNLRTLSGYIEIEMLSTMVGKYTPEPIAMICGAIATGIVVLVLVAVVGFNDLVRERKA